MSISKLSILIYLHTVARKCLAYRYDCHWFTCVFTFVCPNTKYFNLIIYGEASEFREHKCVILRDSFINSRNWTYLKIHKKNNKSPICKCFLIVVVGYHKNIWNTSLEWKQAKFSISSKWRKYTKKVKWQW